MKKLGITILIAIFTCFLLILIKDEYEHKLLNNASYGLPYLIHKGSVENLFIGSSMFRQGLDAKILDENEKDNFILSYNGNNPTLELWEIKYLLEHNVKIQNIYMDMYAYSLTSPPSISDSKILMEVDLKGKYELYKLLNSTWNFNDFYNIFVLKNTDILLTWPIYYKLVNSTYYKGGINTGKEGIDTEKLNSLTMIEESEIQDENIKAIHEIITICKEKNIHLSFIETPKSERITNDTNYQNLISTYQNILEEEQVKYYLAKNTSNSIGNDSYNFFDLIHLSNSGREKYSRDLIQFLFK